MVNEKLQKLWDDTGTHGITKDIPSQAGVLIM